MNLFEIYKKLHKTYGKQGWWPVKVESKKLKVKSKKLRFENELAYGIPYPQLKKYKTPWRDPYYEIAVGAILTQSAAWKNVALAINNLYAAKCLTPSIILKLPSAKLQKFIKPAGYFRQKAKKLKLFSRWLINDYAGDITRLKNYDLHVTRSKLLAQWGIGPETADSIILYALNKPIFVIDEYTRRLCKKFGVEFKTYDEYQKFFEQGLANYQTTVLFREYHALIVASGKNSHNLFNK